MSRRVRLWLAALVLVVVFGCGVGVVGLTTNDGRKCYSEFEGCGVLVLPPAPGQRLVGGEW